MMGQYLKRERIPKALKECHVVNSYINMYFESKYNALYITNLLIDGLNADHKDDIFKCVQIDFDEKSTENTTSFYHNSQIKIKVEDTVISLNCNGKYPGWDIVYKYIKEVLYKVQSIDGNIKFPIAEVDYMSAFLDVQIFQKLENEVNLINIPNFDNMKLEFECEFQGLDLSAERAKVHTIIQNNVPVNKDHKASIFNIKVTHRNKERTTEVLLQDIPILHKAEKDLFFNLISEDYINEWKPIYE